MDAAIDAMLPYGFAESHVQKVVKLLLKEYGGDEGWPFIEEFSYKELIEAMLRDQEAHDQTTAVEDGNPSQDKSCDDKEPPARTSSRTPDVQKYGPRDNAAADIASCSGVAAEPTTPEFFCSTSVINNAKADGKDANHTPLDQTTGNIKTTADLVNDNGKDTIFTAKVDSPRISRINPPRISRIPASSL